MTDRSKDRHNWDRSPSGPREAQSAADRGAGPRQKQDEATHHPMAAVRFRALAAAHPDRPAILTRARTLSYADTWAASDRIAHRLKAEGAGPGTLIGVYASRSEAAVLATLGVTLAGAAYVPLDPTHAPEQLAFIVRDLGLETVLVAERYRNAAAQDVPGTAQLIPIEAMLATPEAAVVRDPSPEPPRATSSAFEIESETAADADRWADPAYVMYTSGTTGTPKGVVMPNRALTVYPYQRFLGIGPGDVVLHHCTLAADGAVFDIWCPLLNGAALAIVEDDVPTARAVTDTMRRHRVTCAGWYAGLHHIAIDYDIDAFATMRFSLSGGDRMSAPHVARLLARWPEIEVYNSFGPTETCVGALAQRVSAEMAAVGHVPIGHPYEGYEAFLMDAEGAALEQCPGAEGEIAIAGPTLADGYHNHPEKTAEAFVADPRPGRNGRVYRTGDLARILDDGAFAHCGRTDRQAKIGGRRVELDGVEAALGADAGVAAAAVWSVERPGGRALEAAIVLRHGPADAAQRTAVAAQVRRRVAAHAGDAVLPARLNVVETMPLTSAGKVDRAELAARFAAERSSGAPAVVDTDAAAPEEACGPTSDIETLLGRIWQDLLGGTAPAPGDTFFEAGGTSLQLVEAHARIERALGTRVPIVELFSAPRFCDQVARLKALATGAAAVPVSVRHPQDTRPDDDRAIAVVGMAARLPGLSETGHAALDAFWQALVAGRSLITHFAPEDLEDDADAETRARDDYVAARPVIAGADLFDAASFGIRPRDAAKMDPQARLFLELCRHALDDAGIVGRGSHTAVFAAATQSTYLLHNLLEDRSALARFTGEHQMGDMARLTGNSVDSLATRVAHKLQLTGPAMSVGAACSGSLVAVAQAVACLRAGQADAALAGGVSLSFPQRRGYLAQEGGIGSLDGTCRPYDAKANGTVFGDGAGVLVLKRLTDALRDGDPVRAVIRGVGLTNDGGDKVAYTAPSVAGQATTISAAHRDAGLSPAEIGYVEGHGTATPLGDPIEVAALARAFAQSSDHAGAVAGAPCWLGSVKGNIGHSDAAAGVLGAIKTVLALQNGQIPQVANFTSPNPQIDFPGSGFAVPEAPVTWETRRAAGVSSFGVGGTNVHLILTEPPQGFGAETDAGAHAELSAAAPEAVHVLPVSASSTQALAEAREALADALDRPGAPALARVAATLQTGRSALSVRCAVAARTAGEAADRLRGATVGAAAAPESPRLVFLLPGQGAQYPGMGAGLYRAEPGYRAVIDAGAEILTPLLGQDIRPVMHGVQNAEGGADADRALRQTRLTQPALFLTEVALARLWQSRGIVPAALVGHSVGEIAAAHLAGVMSFEDGLRLIARRGQVMQDQPEGAMLSVRATWEGLQAHWGDGLDLAARNAETMQVVAGPVSEIAALEERLADASIPARRLHTSHAFHSRMMDPVVEGLRPLCADIALRAPEVPILSTVTGDWMSEAEACNPDYWAGQARACVVFADAMRVAAAGPIATFLEVGPGRTLATFAAQTLGRSSQGGPGSIVTSLPGAGEADGVNDDLEAIAAATGALWTRGMAVDWSRAGAPAETRRVSLPGTMFDRRSHWVEPPLASKKVGAAVPLDAGPVCDAADPAPTGTALGSAAPDWAAPDRVALEEQLLALLGTLSGEALGADLVDTSFLELGFDSLFLGEVVAALRDTFGVKLTFRSLLTDTPTVRALADVLAPRVAVAAPGGSAPSAAAPVPAPLVSAHPGLADAAAVDGVLRGGEGSMVPEDMRAVMVEQIRALETLFAAQLSRLEQALPAPASHVIAVGERAAPPEPLGELAPTECQREIWLVHQLGPAQAAAFNEGLEIELTGPLDRPALEHALSDLVARHEALRLQFARSGETFRILPEVEIDLRYHDLATEPDPNAKRAEILENEGASPLPLTEGVPFRIVLLRVAEARHILVLTVHHIACDGWSFGTLLRELGQLYAARAAQRLPTLPPAPSFAAHARAQATRVPDAEALRWWKGRLSDAPPLPELPVDHPRTGERRFRGGTVVATLPADVIAGARATGARAGCTLHGTLLGTLQIVLGRLSGASDVVIGVPSGGQADLPDPSLVGHCVNLLPVRAPIAAGASLATHLSRVGAELSEVFDRRGITFGTLLKALDVPRDLRRQPLTEVQFNLERAHTDLSFGALRVEARGAPKAFVNFDLFFDVAEQADGLRVSVHYNADLFEAETIERWVGHWLRVLQHCAAAPETPVAKVDLMSRELTERLVDGLNQTEVDLPYLDVPARIAAQAWRTPEAIATEDADGSLSYRALDAHADAVAAAVQAHFAAPGGRVAVCLPRDRFLPAVLLGVMRAGATYIPLDAEQPAGRRHQVIEAGRADALLATPATADVTAGRPVIDVTAIKAGAVPIPIPADPARPAYIIFTSGSTGTPKGVCVPMEGLANLLHAMAQKPGFTPSDRLLAITTTSFDIAALEIFGPLTVGGALRVASREDILGGGPVAAELSQGAFSVMQATPTFWALLLELGIPLPRGLRVWIGGEPLPPDLAQRLLGQGVELWNLYGPTETTIWSAAKRISEGQPITIGGPIANTELHVLDTEGQLIPPGAIGELYIGGRGLALGYFDRPDLTDAAFREVPLEGRARRLYATGDLARRRPDGEIELLGRRDGQVKLRGFRLELGEVESHLRADPAVAGAASGLVGDGSEARLAAWLVAREGATVDIAALAERLSGALPEYMVPSHWGMLEKMPQTANGKLDRRALPPDAVQPLGDALRRAAGATEGSPEEARSAFEGGKGASANTPGLNPVSQTESGAQDGLKAVPGAATEGSVKPGETLGATSSAELEDRLATIWAEVLGRPYLDRRATLYQLGADSLTVFRLAARQLAEGIEAEARDVLAHPSISKLAAHLAARADVQRPGSQRSSPRSVAQRPALSDFFGGNRRRPRRTG
ncbi:MAG: amino acid adenylation domain-containing protein [Pseudomonadota bacterium]